MAMLAEPKRKQKWSLNPRGKQWSEDSNKFGQKMLEKMGWTSGKGLGANEQGMTEHVRVKFKGDAGGIGYSQDDQDKNWTEHQENFNDLLQKLQTGDEPSQSAPPEIKKSTDLSGTSLEMKSKQSRARVHYQKFTRGKDVNKYSTKDLANIFGKKDLQESPKAPESLEPPPDDPPAPLGSTDNTGGVVTIKGGSMSDYFKSKFLNFHPTPKKSQRDDDKSSESECERYVGFGFSSPSISSKLSHDISDNKTPKKRKSEFYVETPNSSSKMDENSRESKKFKSSGEKLEFNSPEVENSAKKLKKKKKSEKLKIEIEENSSSSENPLENPQNPTEICSLDSPVKKSKKKKKKDVEPVECIPQVLSPSIPPENPPGPPKKPPRFFLKNRGLDLESPDPSIPSETPKKLKNLKKKNVEIEENSVEIEEIPQVFVFRNPALKLESPEPEEVILETPKSLKKPKTKKIDNFEGFLNPGLNLNSKIDDNPIVCNNFEVSRDPGVSYEDPDEILETPKSLKKNKKKKIENCAGLLNPALNLNSKTNDNSMIANGFEVSRDPGVLYQDPEEVLEIPKSLKKNKKNKSENCAGNWNPGLNLNSEIDHNSMIASGFEVSRDPGVSNEAIDLSDECTCKKRVTFNDEVEYNIDSSKKKKLKRKLDKFEVDNEKLKKKKKRVTGFINPALDVEIISEEVIDNEENERKSQENQKNERRKKKRRISSLETIAEIPEEEIFHGVVGDNDHVDDENYETPKKKKKKNRKIEKNFDFDCKENVEKISKKSKKGEKKLREEVEHEVLQQNNSVIEFDSPGDERLDRSKRKLKSLFSKSPVLHFTGSNINDIKGYGTEM